MTETEKPIIVGGGFSGAMLAARLAELGLGSTLINRSPDVGLGVAYSTRVEAHLLNVRSERMGAVEGRPDDFVEWLKADHPAHADPEGFAPRRLFGLYVQNRLRNVEKTRPGLIDTVIGDVTAITEDGVALAGGRIIAGHTVVLATGNPAPRTAETLFSERVVHDPWAAEALDRVGLSDDVIILGSGLTMVDVLLALDSRGWRGRATVVSRRGLTPRAHGARHDPVVAPTQPMTAGPASGRLAAARESATRCGWRSMMDGLRPSTADLWIQADPATRGRWLRHLRPWWDVHRHRIAPQVAAALDRLVTEGRLTVKAGRIGEIDADDRRVSIIWRPRGDAAQASLSAGWLIDCTGPGHDPMDDGLTGPLIRSRVVGTDPLGFGLQLDATGAATSPGPESTPQLFVLGPPAQASFWETTAVPDIRKRIDTLAIALAERGVKPRS